MLPRLMIASNIWHSLRLQTLAMVTRHAAMTLMDVVLVPYNKCSQRECITRNKSQKSFENPREKRKCTLEIYTLMCPAVATACYHGAVAEEKKKKA